MKKTRVFIYGSCVSRDTFEYFNQDDFELAQYVARQSTISAYTKPVELVMPPKFDSPFQQRMVSGDFASSLRSVIPALSDVDLVLMDITDERLGVYVLPDGSVITRSLELIESGAERILPDGTHHIPFGSETHFQYWRTGIDEVASLLDSFAPRCSVAILGIPWAEFSENGSKTPTSFGMSAETANTLMRQYIDYAANALGAEVIAPSPETVRSSPTHPWGDAPFHYSPNVYESAARCLTGKSVEPDHQKRPQSIHRASSTDMSNTPDAWSTLPKGRLQGGPDFLIAGTQRGATGWLQKQLERHPDVSFAAGKGSYYFSRKKRLLSATETEGYIESVRNAGPARFIGDNSPTYFWHSAGRPFSPKRFDTAGAVREYLGSVPTLVSLRDPVSRAVSAYWHHFAAGRYDASTGIFRVPPGLGVIDHGFYQRHYNHWASTLGPEFITVLIYDDVSDRPADCVRTALSAIGVNPDEDFLAGVSSKTKVNRSQGIDRIRRSLPVSTQEIAALVEIYREDVEFVEHLTNRDLSHWLDVKELSKSLSA